MHVHIVDNKTKRSALQYFLAVVLKYPVLTLVSRKVNVAFASFSGSVATHRLKCGVLHWKTITQLRNSKASDRNRRRFNQLAMVFFALYVSWVVKCGLQTIFDTFFDQSRSVTCHTSTSSCPSFARLPSSEPLQLITINGN